MSSETPNIKIFVHWVGSFLRPPYTLPFNIRYKNIGWISNQVDGYCVEHNCPNINIEVFYGGRMLSQESLISQKDGCWCIIPASYEKGNIVYTAPVEITEPIEVCVY